MFKKLLSASLFALMTLLVVPAWAAAHQVIDDNDTVTLPGNVHPHARTEYEVGAAAPTLPMDRMTLALRLSTAQLADLNQLLVRQQDPASPNYHQWLTPEEFGSRFGASAADLATVNGWLRKR